MADLLGSILGSMQKPPGLGDEERKKQREQKKQLEKLQQEEKASLDRFRLKIQQRVNEFIKDATLHKFKFEPMDKVYRAIAHEVADVAGLTSFSFGQDEMDRYVMLWKKEYAPSDDELLAYRRGEEWNPEKAKQLAQQREMDKQLEEESRKKPTQIIPNCNYKDKYQHLIGVTAAKDAAHITTANKNYGFVSSENKRDRRTIEQVMADNRAKRLKTDQDSDAGTSAEGASSQQCGKT